MADYNMYNGAPIKIKMTFDNNATYEASSANTTNNVIQTGNISENESINSGNPLGIMTSNKVHLEILDLDGVLIATNTASPYFGYMRSGVKVELWEYRNSTWVEMGTYYTNGWDNRRKNGGYTTSQIDCQDRLNYIGGMQMPELESYASVNMIVLLEAIFQGIGLTSSDYYIDPSLDATLNVSITKGERVRDNINSIAQALLARITMGRDSKIYVRPAFPTMTTAKTIDNNAILDYSIQNNDDMQYNKVTLKYSEIGVKTSETLAEVDNVLISNGVNEVKAISISDRTQGIDGVTVQLTIDESIVVSDYTNIISDITYKGYQGGIDVTFASTFANQIKGKILVLGRVAGSSTKSISKNAPPKQKEEPPPPPPWK